MERQGAVTGWVDVGLSDQGAREAAYGGRLLAEGGNSPPDVVHTSELKRAIQTANIALEAADLLRLPVSRSWRPSTELARSITDPRLLIGVTRPLPSSSPERIVSWIR